MVRLPNVVLGLALDLDAQPGVVPVLLLDGVEHHDNVLVQLVEAVVHEALELAADEAIALEGEGTVPLAILDIFLDGPLRHEGNELPAGVKDQRVEVLDVEGGQVLQDLVVALGLDVGLAVPGLDAVDAEVHINVQGAGGGEGQGGLADARVAGNQHTDLLGALLDFVGISNHCSAPFSLNALISSCATFSARSSGMPTMSRPSGAHFSAMMTISPTMGEPWNCVP